MILSYDTIMKPPYEITSLVLELVASISVKLGEIKANFLSKPSPKLRKLNKIRTIHSSLSIEGNTLSQEQITAILENKRVMGPPNEIKEVENANKIYSGIAGLDPYAIKSFLSAHKTLMDVGILHGAKVGHLATQPEKDQELASPISSSSFARRVSRLKCFLPSSKL